MTLLYEKIALSMLAKHHSPYCQSSEQVQTLLAGKDWIQTAQDQVAKQYKIRVCWSINRRHLNSLLLPVYDWALDLSLQYYYFHRKLIIHLHYNIVSFNLIFPYNSLLHLVNLVWRTSIMSFPLPFFKLLKSNNYS